MRDTVEVAILVEMMSTKVELVTGTVVVKSYCPALSDRGQVSSSGDMCRLLKLLSPTDITCRHRIKIRQQWQVKVKLSLSSSGHRVKVKVVVEKRGGEALPQLLPPWP